MTDHTLTRRQFFGYSAALGASLYVTAPLRAGDPDKITWVSPRGNLEVMDDFNLWVAEKMGYFRDLNLDVTLQPGPTEALAVTKLVGQHQADIGFPSPGVLLSSIDAGIPVILVWEMVMKQVFDFALPKNSSITRVQDLKGKTIAVGSEGWRVIIDPILVEAGIDPSSVTYLNGDKWSPLGEPTRDSPGEALPPNGRPLA
jgi:NitT/TauT family transport system substrate-binding protein